MSYRSVDDLRARKERLAAAIAEKRKRDERALQSDLGEPGRPGGLLHFIRYFWHVLEPTTPLVEGWVLHGICMHLEAVTRGEIRRLLINVPPGFMKSLCTNVFWPLWEWSAAGRPSERFVTFSYGAHLTLRDNAKFRDLAICQDFQDLWGHVFELKKAGEVKPENNHTGWKFASSVGGIGTGERGSRVLCLAGDQKVATENGPLAIRDIVRDRLPIRVWSHNVLTGHVELRPVTNWHENPGRPLVKITTQGGASVTCTEDHKIYTADGLRRADALAIGDNLIRAPSILVGRESQVQVSPLSATANSVNRGGAGVELPSQRDQRRGSVIGANAPRNLAHQFFRKMRRPVLPSPVALAVSNVVSPRAVLQIAKDGIARVPVLMADLLSCGARAYKRFYDQAVDHPVLGFAVNPQRDPRVALVGGSGHDLAYQSHRVARTPSMVGTVGVNRWGTFARDNAGNAFHAPQIRHLVEPLVTDDWKPFFDTVTAIEFLHDIPHATYCVTVAGNGNLFCGGEAQLLTKNCDDLHSVRYAESETVRGETVRWVREGMSNRLNNMIEDVIIGIGQRVHEQDASNAMLQDGDYVHFMVPMEYDPTRHCSTPIWEDPRTEDGELAWPERFPADVVAKLKRTLGPTAYSAQYQQSPEPRGGGILKRDWWGTYELAVGASFRHKFELIVASLDPAFTAKQENDPSGFTVWGVYEDQGNPKVVLLHAWKRWLELHGQTMERLPNEDNRSYVRRASPAWGLVEWVAHDCTRLQVNTLLIEDKASGHSVAQEIRRLYGESKWGTLLINPGNLDKRARAYAVQHLWADGVIEAPASVSGDLLVFREWAQMVIDECARFRGLAGDEDNLVDSATQCIKWLRDRMLLVRADERRAIENSRMSKRHGPRPHIYPV